MKIKVCGLKNKKDVLFCAYEGVDALGFFVSSEHNDSLSLDEAKQLISSVPPFTASVLVTDATSSSAIIAMAYYASPSAIQLQRNIDVDEIIKIRRSISCCKLIKTVYIDNKEDLLNIQEYFDIINLLLIDSKSDMLMSEEDLKKIAQEIAIPVIFSEKIFEKYKDIALPYCIDIRENVENQNGSKDYEKIRDLIRKIKKYNTLKHDDKVCLARKNFHLLNRLYKCC